MSRKVLNGRRKINNSGYSIVELIIVIAIMAVIIATVSFSINLIFSANARGCANALERAIADCKVTTMGKNDAYLRIYRDTDENVYAQMFIIDRSGNEVPQDPEKLGGRRVRVGYLPSGASAGDEPTEITGSTTVEIRFDRASGSFVKANHDACATFDIRGGRRHYLVEMIQLTGKVQVERQ